MKKFLSFFLFSLMLIGSLSSFFVSDSSAWISEDGLHIAEFYYTDFDDANENLNYYNNTWVNVSGVDKNMTIPSDPYNPSDLYLYYAHDDLDMTLLYNKSLNLTSFSMTFNVSDDTQIYIWNDSAYPFRFHIDCLSTYVRIGCIDWDSESSYFLMDTNINENTVQNTLITIGFEIRVGNEVLIFASTDNEFESIAWNKSLFCINDDRLLTVDIENNGDDLYIFDLTMIASNGYYDETFFDENGNMRSFGTDHNSLRSWSDWPNDCFDSASWIISPNDFGAGSYNEVNSFWWSYNTPDNEDLNGEIKNFHTIVRYTWRKDTIPFSINTMALWIKINARFNLYYNSLSKKVFVSPVISYIPNSYTSTDYFHSAYYELSWSDLTDLYNNPLYCNESEIFFRVLIPGNRYGGDNDIIGHLLNYESNPVYDGGIYQNVGFRKYSDKVSFGTNNYISSGYIWTNKPYARPLYYFSWDDIGTSQEENEYGISINSYSSDFYLGTNVKVEWWCNTSLPNPNEWTVWIIDSNNTLFFNNDYSTSGFTGFTLKTSFPTGTYNAYLFDKGGNFDDNNRKTVSFVVKNTYIPPSGTYFIAQNFSNQPLKAGDICNFDWIASTGTSFYVLLKDIGIAPPLEMFNITFYESLTGTGSWKVGSFTCPNVNYSTYWRMFVYYTSNNTYYYPSYHTNILVQDSTYIGHTVDVRYNEVYSGVSNWFGWTHPFDSFTYYVGVFNDENVLIDTAWDTTLPYIQSSFGNEYGLIIDEIGTYTVLLYRYVGSNIYVEASTDFEVLPPYSEDPDVTDEEGSKIILGLFVVIGCGLFGIYFTKDKEGFLFLSLPSAFVLSMPQLGDYQMLPTEVAYGIIACLVLLVFTL